MPTDANTITELEQIKAAIKVLNKHLPKLTRHIAEQKKQQGWDKDAKHYGTW